MSLEREKLKKLATDATPGPWEYQDGETNMGEIYCLSENRTPNGIELFKVLGDSGQQYSNAEFVAAADPSTILALLSQLESSEAALRTLREASACSVTDPKVAMAGRNFAVVKMTFPTRKQAETFKTALAAALAAEGKE